MSPTRIESTLEGARNVPALPRILGLDALLRVVARPLLGQVLVLDRGDIVVVLLDNQEELRVRPDHDRVPPAIELEVEETDPLSGAVQGSAGEVALVLINLLKLLHLEGAGASVEVAGGDVGGLLLLALVLELVSHYRLWASDHNNGRRTVTYLNGGSRNGR